MIITGDAPFKTPLLLTEPTEVIKNQFKTILEGHESIQIQKESINHILNNIPIEQIENLFSHCITQFPLSELGKLAGLIESKEVALPLIKEVIQHFMSFMIPDEERKDNCMLFIDQMNSTMDLANCIKPLILPLFLIELEKESSFDSILLDQIDTFDETNKLLLLWSLTPDHLSDYISSIDVEENPYLPVKLLNDLFSLEKDNSSRASLIPPFTESLDESEMELFLNALINTNSPAIPYLLVGMSDEQFEDFTINTPRPLMHRVLLKSIPSNDLNMQWVIHKLNDSGEINRLHQLCEEVEFDQTSQETKSVGNLVIPTYLTLKKLCEIIGSNKDDPENFLKFFQEDILATPPFLFALGIYHPEFQEHITLQSRMLSNEQLRAIAISLSEKELIRSLSALFQFLRVDQIYLILNTLTMKSGIFYANHQAEQLTPVIKEIEQLHLNLKEEVQSEQNSHHLLSFEAKIQGKIRDILSPVNLQLKRVLDSYRPYCPFLFKDEPMILKMIERCKNILQEIEAPQGLLQQIHQRIPQEHSHSKNLSRIVRKKTLEILQLDHLDQLHQVGIYTERDLNILKIYKQSDKIEKLKRYLDQPELHAIWQYFHSKQLYSLSTLEESCLFEHKKEAFDLKTLAIKLGYVSNDQTD